MVKNTVYLSREAVRQNEGNSYVMVLMDDVPIELPVTVGVQTPIYSEILSILEPHKKVIIGDWEKQLADSKKSNSKRLSDKWNYRKGKMHGICESFYPEGDQIIFSRSTYQDGKRIEERTFHRNGLLKSKTIGEYPNYTQESYDENGKFTSKFMVKDGKYFYFKGTWKDKFRLWLWSLKHVIVMTKI